MCRARVLDDDFSDAGRDVAVPKVYIRAAVSPTTRPTDKIIPDKIPGIATGSTTLKIVLSLPAPRAKEPCLIDG